MALTSHMKSFKKARTSLLPPIAACSPVLNTPCLRRPYGGSFSVAKVVGSRYIIIAGNLTYSTIQAFLAYLFHPGSTRGEPSGDQ